MAIEAAKPPAGNIAILVCVTRISPLQGSTSLSIKNAYRMLRAHCFPTSKRRSPNAIGGVDEERTAAEKYLIPLTLGHTTLPQCSSPTCSFGLLWRAKPSLALTNIHSDFGVELLARHVVDAFTVLVHIAFNNAFGRRRPFSCRPGQQNRLCIDRNTERSEDDRLVVAVTPIPRRNECALP